MALSYEQKHLEIIDRFKKLSSKDSDEWVLRLDPWPKREKQKTCVACVAKKPENQDNSCQEPSLGIIVLYLDQTTFKVVKVDSSACLAAKLSDNFFLGKSLQEFCRRNEWPTVDLILETAPRVEGACAELTFVVDGRNVATRASMLRSFSADEPHQLRCEILKSLPEPVCRSMSLAVPEPSTSTIMLSNNATEFEVHDGATFGLNRTFSTPPEVAVVPGPTKRRNSRKGRARETQLSRLDSVIDSVASASTEVTNSEPSLLKSMLETKRPLDSFQNDGGWPLVTEPEPYNSPKCFQSAILPGMDFPNPETKKKRQKASKPRKTASFMKKSVK
uniref:Uncharacterized protein n=1 Tax=Panagrolaimus sp. JU765 TaxID=591449 RepID=A0AC34R242_9BILA